MPFMKYARAQVMHPRITGAAWQGIRKQASSAPTASKNLVAQAGEILGETFSPDRYLLTHCFPAGHAVLMSDGTEKPIEQVQVGDLVVTHKGNIKPVTRLLRKEVDEHLTVLQAASLPEVAVTGEHPFYVIREKNAWCKVFPSYQGQVKCTYGGKQVCESNTCLTNGAVPEWVDANAVQVGDRTYTPTLHETQVASDLNPNRMRVLGYFVAEGYVSKDNTGREHGVHFSLHQDEVPTLGAEIARLMRLEFGVGTHAIASHEGSKGVTLSFYTHTHAPWFLQHAGKGSRDKRLSPSVMWAPHEWQKQLLGAWLNGDGHYGGTNQGGAKGIRLATSSNDLASQAVVLLDRVGVHSRLQRVIQETGREYRGRYIKGFDGWHVEVSVSYLMKLADVVRWPVTGNVHKNLSTKGRYRYAASTLSTVEQVSTRPYKGTVYNFSVQDDESYVVNRMAVHNCSIVASVDVDAVPNVRLGTEKVGSRTVTRKWADYYIKPECAQFVNNNGDSWSREVLMKSFRTFIGAHNFLEHVQIEEQSKGRIIDAVARDIGPSVYIDILVATDRKHAQLVQDIESGKMGTLSMGCFLPGTMVSLADGTRRPIEDIQPGDMVLTHKGRAREVANQQIRRRDWSLRRIQAVGVPDEIVATDTHPFFVYRAPTTCACGCGEPLPTPKNGRKQSKRAMSRRFKTGHDKRVFNPKNTYSLEEHRERKARLEALQEWVLEEVPAGELREGDLLCFPRAHFDHGRVPVSKERAALLGYYLAEGNLLKHKGEVCGVEFTFGLSEQDTYAAEVTAFLAQEFPTASVATYTRLDRNTFTVRATDADTASWFHTHGGEYSSRKKVSPEVLLWEQDAHLALLGAWVSGDGHLDGRGVTTAVTTSYDLACQLHLLAARCGMFASLQVGVRGRSVEAKQVVNGGVVLRDEATGRYPAFTLRFGQTQAQGLVGFTDKVVPSPTNKSQANRVFDGMVTFPVTAISSEPYFGFVYDLEVEEDHSYVVEGVAVHNCSCEFTLCSQCGNVAVDETDLCEHVKYSKLNTFFDARGQRRVIAELCGHATHGETGGVHFIEASWVAVPAFAGAVMRNILDPGSVSPQKAKQFSEVLSAPPAEWGTNILRAASEQRTAQQFDFGADEGGDEGGGGEGGGGDAKPPEKPTSPFADMEDELYTAVKNRVKERLEKELREQNVEKALDTPTAPNESVIKEAAATKVALQKFAREAHARSVATLLRVASSDAAFVDGLVEIDRSFGLRVPQSVYRTALTVGATANYISLDEYCIACHKQARRVLTPTELRVAYRIGNLLTRKGSVQPPQPRT